MTNRSVGDIGCRIAGHLVSQCAMSTQPPTGAPSANFPQIRKLVQLGGPPLSDATPRLSPELTAIAGAGFEDLLPLYRAKNGFFAFESALWVYPAGDPQARLGVEQWNAPGSWRGVFGEFATEGLFFAADAVGGQFCHWRGAIYRFGPETGARELFAASVEQWAGAVLSDIPDATLWPLAQRWQQMNGPLASTDRLVPRQLFCLGGAYAPENLMAKDAIEAMRMYGGLAQSLKDVPDGSTIQIRIVG